MHTKSIYLIHNCSCLYTLHTGIIRGPNDGTMVKASSKTAGNTSCGLAPPDDPTQRLHSFGQGESCLRRTALFCVRSVRGSSVYVSVLSLELVCVWYSLCVCLWQVWSLQWICFIHKTKREFVFLVFILDGQLLDSVYLLCCGFVLVCGLDDVMSDDYDMTIIKTQN